MQITVQAVGNQAPNSVINTPSSNQVINVGDSVSFSGTGSDPDNNTPFTYSWNFGSGSGIGNTSSRNPGSRTFNNAGVFTVTFTVTDSLGLPDPTPDTVQITVQAVGNQAPNGVINTPSSNQVINVGDSVSFSGTGSDPDGNTPFTYSWNFGSGSGIGNTSSRNPGSKTFNNAGVFTVTFTVTDSLGLPDPTPDTVQITVNSGGGGQFSDDFSLDTTGNYTVTHTLTSGGVGSFSWDSAGKRVNVLTEDNVALQFSRDLPSIDNGTFSIDFLPTAKYPLGGWIELRLMQDANNYYELSNSDGYGPFQLKKVVGGVEVDSVPFLNGYSQNINYKIEINFSPNLTTVNAFGNVIIINTDSTNILVNKFECEITQQDAFFDNILLNSTGNQAPNGVINTPVGNRVINVGQSINFTGTGSDPDNNTPLAYSWNFGAGSGIGNSSSEDPGSRTFNSVGVFTVTFTVTDSLGLPDPTPDTVQITVNSGGGGQFSDDFSLDTTGNYTVTHTLTSGGVGSFSWDSAGKRVNVLTEDNVALQFSRDLPSIDNGTFSIDFLPTAKYPIGGWIELRLMQDANNYYELSNSDGYGPYQMKKIVGGVEVENVPFTNGYVQNTNYTISINFGPALTTVNAFGNALTLNTDTTSILINKFEIETIQQDAYYDNILLNSTSPALFSDDFSLDTTGNYTVTHTLTSGGVGSFSWDSAGKRVNVLTEDNVALQFSRDLPSIDNGTFSIDFLPTTKYPIGGWIELRLMQDANNYYELSNSDGYGPYQMKKIVGGVEVENVPFTNGYVQNTNYTITINFSPTQTTVNGFGNVLTLNTDTTSILINKFEIETIQQDAYYDNIMYQ